MKINLALMSKVMTNFKRYKSTPEKKGDWVSLSGEYERKTFDEFGGSLGQAALNEFVRKPSQKTKFFQQIDNHFQKADYVVLNLPRSAEAVKVISVFG
jgi:hypothetical protein